jgi:hypothetical protein
VEPGVGNAGFQHIADCHIVFNYQYGLFQSGLYVLQQRDISPQLYDSLVTSPVHGRFSASLLPGGSIPGPWQTAQTSGAESSSLHRVHRK